MAARQNGSQRKAESPFGEMERHAGEASQLLRALANPRRLQLLCVLGESEMSVGALNECIPISQSALSQHLAVLRADGLVATRRESQTIYYRIEPGPALEVIRVLHRHYCAIPRRNRTRAQQQSRDSNVRMSGRSSS